MTAQTTRELTYLEAVREALIQEMRRDPAVFLLGEDIGVYGGAFGVTRGLLEEFGPERIRETPISEAAIAGVATGAALMGLRPVMEIMFMDFITISMNQLVNQAAKMRFMFGGKASIPMVCRTPAGSGTGAAAQHIEIHYGNDHHANEQHEKARVAAAGEVDHGRSDASFGRLPGRWRRTAEGSCDDSFRPDGRGGLEEPGRRHRRNP